MNKKKLEIIEFFKSVKFTEDGHKYHVDGSELGLSVSGLVKKFVKFTDFPAIARRTDAKFNYPEGSTQKLWDLKKDAACAKGNRAHFFGEMYAFHRTVKPNGGLEEAIVKFWKSLPKHIVPVFTELEMYHKRKMFGGTADIILYNTRTEKFIIADYKTNEELFNNFAGKKLIGAFKFLREDNFNKYQIQFSSYQVLLEQVPGIEVERRVLVWLKPDGTFKRLDCADYTNEVRNYLINNEVCQ